MYHYNKLVRDNIPDIMLQKGKKLTYHAANSEQEIWYHLMKKLQEEINSFSVRQSLTQYVDIIDVLNEIQTFRNFEDTEVQAHREDKNAQLGGFNQHWILENSEEKFGDDYIDIV